MSEKAIVDFRALPKLINKPYRKFLLDTRRYQIYKGGGSAGKSVFITQKILYGVSVLGGYNVLVIRKVGVTNHDSTFSELRKRIYEWGMGDLFEVNRSKGAEEIRSRITGNKILFKGLDDVEKLKSITFETGDLVCIWVEEASEISEEEFNQLTIRLRGISKIRKHIILSFNPIDSDLWIKTRFFDMPINETDGYICETTYRDNAFLASEDIQTLENLRNIDWYYYQVYCLNKWGNRAGTKVFFNLEIHDFDIIEHRYENMRHGLDFGFNHAQAFIGTGYVDGELYIFKELYAKQKTNKAFIKLLDDSNMFDKSFSITADSEAPDKIAEWEEEGYKIYPSKKGKGSVSMGIDYFKSLPKIHIHKTNCPNAAKEFAYFKYRQSKDGQALDGQYVELKDDTIAAVRYANEEFFLDYGSAHISARGIYE